MLLHRSGFTLLAVAQYYLVFVERKPGRRPKTVNLAVEEKEASRKRARRRAAKANFSRSVVVFFFWPRNRGRERLSLLHLPLHLSAPPPLSCLTPRHHFHLLFPLLRLLGTLGRQRPSWLRAAQCSGGVNPLIGCHYPAALPTRRLN